jgi:hypothetical protein
MPSLMPRGVRDAESVPEFYEPVHFLGRVFVFSSPGSVIKPRIPVAVRTKFSTDGAVSFFTRHFRVDPA